MTVKRFSLSCALRWNAWKRVSSGGVHAGGGRAEQARHGDVGRAGHVDHELLDDLVEVGEAVLLLLVALGAVEQQHAVEALQQRGHLEALGQHRLAILAGQHVAIAEAALGKPLPRGAEVHHVDENPANNAPGNLVICPSAAYHKLLHQRQRAFDACGHYDWRRCTFCKTYDKPENLSMNRKQAWHRECMAASKRKNKPEQAELEAGMRESLAAAGVKPKRQARAAKVHG